ncbi:hypothetical protein [Pararhizobium arenae]|uniref:hypothetical protein n=1 Tax=Pararhizobium arenae TaxID=1856850 RepID=UPI00094AAC9A|nr:hypothetical protein [Pararhizobium arenae]
MRVIFVLTAAALVTAGLFVTMKIPNVKAVERLLTSYRADPEETSKRLEAAVLECTPGIAESPIGIDFAKTIITPLYVNTLELRIKGASKSNFNLQLQEWIKTNHPELLTALPDRDFRELVGYLKKVGEDDVENCILSSAISGESVMKTSSNKWDLRI